MRIAFAGSSDFSLASLRACIDHCEVAVVITQPDKPGSRGKPAPRPVADLAASAGIPVLQPRRIRDTAEIDGILAYNIDAFVLASYGQIVPVALLDKPRFGSFNVHPSLLPRWRGATPIPAAILAGDTETGVCIMRMEEGLDTGPVYARQVFALDSSATTPLLTKRLADVGAALLTAVLAQVEDGTAQATPQPNDGVTHCGRLSKKDGLVDWAEHDAVTVDRMVRALNLWPGVAAIVGDRNVILRSGRIHDTSSVGRPGEIVTVAGGFGVQTMQGIYAVTTIQTPGRNVVTAAEFLRGLH